MTIREEIIQVLEDNSFSCYANYTLLKECINLKSSTIGQELGIHKDIDSIDNWFSGIISSLFYKPNKYFLLLKGEDLGLSIFNFFIDLFPDKSVFCGSTYIIEPHEISLKLIKYNFLLGCFECPERVHIDLTTTDDFTAWTREDAKMFEDGTPQPECDKRLISYCGITEKWHNPLNKNCIVLEVDSIDWEKFNSIPKLKLWQEIFNKFK